MHQKYRDVTVDSRVDESCVQAAGNLSEKSDFVVRTLLNVVRVVKSIHETSLSLENISKEFQEVDN